MRPQSTYIRRASRWLLEVLRASATEGIAPPPVTDSARTGEKKEPTSEYAARNRTPLRADVSERALLEGDDILEPALLAL